MKSARSTDLETGVMMIIEGVTLKHDAGSSNSSWWRTEYLLSFSASRRLSHKLAPYGKRLIVNQSGASSEPFRNRDCGARLYLKGRSIEAMRILAKRKHGKDVLQVQGLTFTKLFWLVGGSGILSSMIENSPS